MKLPEIEFKFWSEQNHAYSSQALSSKVIGMSKIAAKYGMTSSIMEEIETFSQLVGEIESRISSIKSSRYNAAKEDFLTVFDLIQIWGGITGRSPYVRKFKRGVSRSDEDLFVDTYKDAISKKDLSPFERLNILNSINGLRDSFSTKHLRFWHSIPVLDIRIRLLLAPCNPKSIKYKNYHDLLILESNRIGIEVLELEKALFAFSNNYFLNDSMVIKTKPTIKIDQAIALALESRYKSCNEE
jgi:hypothetical protein